MIILGTSGIRTASNILKKGAIKKTVKAMGFFNKMPKEREDGFL
jgi:hypothetical protein